MKKSRGRALGPSARPAQTHSSWGRGGSRSRGSRTTGGVWGGTERPGRRSAGGRWARTAQGGGVPQAGAGYHHTRPPPIPTPERPRSRRSALIRWKGPSARGFCPQSAEIQGAQFRKRARTHCGPRLSYKAGRSRWAAGGGARELQSRRVPAAREAGAPRSGAAAASRDVGTRTPGPGALLPGAPTGRSRRGPGPGAGFGAGAEPGPRPVSGCSGNGDVPRRGRGKHAGCIF